MACKRSWMLYNKSNNCNLPALTACCASGTKITEPGEEATPGEKGLPTAQTGDTSKALLLRLWSETQQIISPEYGSDQ